MMVRTQISKSSLQLKGLAIFADLPDGKLEQVWQRCRWQRHEPGEMIVDYLEESNDVFFIIEGEVCVTMYSLAGKAVSFRELGPGEVFGEYPAIDGGPRSASVEARTSCFIASLTAISFMELLEAEPKIAIALLKEFVSKIRSLTNRVYEFSTLAVNNRIQAEILRLAKKASPESGLAQIIPPPTHLEIANRISTHREAVTRELNRLARMDILERRKNALIVKDFDRLSDIVREATGE